MLLSYVEKNVMIQNAEKTSRMMVRQQPNVALRYLFVKTLTVITVTSGFDTKTRLIGHFPLF